MEPIQDDHEERRYYEETLEQRSIRKEDFVEPIQDDIETLTVYGLKCPELGPGRHDFVLASDADRLLAERDRLQFALDSTAAAENRALHLLGEVSAERDRLQAQVESLREERERDVRVATWEVRFSALEAERDLAIEERTAWRINAEKTRGLLRDTLAERDRLVKERDEARDDEMWKRIADWQSVVAERDRLQEKADYWERQYVIESENADDFHAERDGLISGIGALVEKWRYPHITIDQTHYSPMDMMSWCAEELAALTKKERIGE
jgi:hypothetical protein